MPLLDNNLDCSILTIDNKSVRKWGRVWGERDAPRLEFVEDDIVFFFFLILMYFYREIQYLI